MKLARIGLCLVVFATATRALAADAVPALKLLKTFQVGGQGRWDYLGIDADARRLYIPRSTHTQVMDLDSGKILADIPGTNGVHGVALDLAHNLGFASSGRDNAVTVFDLKSYKVTKTIKAGRNPDAILFDPASKHVFAFNHSGGDVSVIDPAALTRDPVTIPVGGALEYGVSDGKGHVYVNVEDKNEVVAIDSKANRVLAHWSVAPGDGPTGLAIDVEHHRLFSGCNKKMIVTDTESGKQLAAVDIGPGVDGVAFEPTWGTAISANGGDGTASVVKETSPGKFEAIQTPKTIKGARTITVDVKQHHALMPCTVPDGKGGQTFGIVVLGAE